MIQYSSSLLRSKPPRPIEKSTTMLSKSDEENMRYRQKMVPATKKKTVPVLLTKNTLQILIQNRKRFKATTPRSSTAHKHTQQHPIQQHHLCTNGAQPPHPRRGRRGPSYRHQRYQGAAKELKQSRAEMKHTIEKSVNMREVGVRNRCECARVGGIDVRE